MSGNSDDESTHVEVDLNLPMKDITDPRETDVLCGRGGAALRHPGNQTYRRLVNLNKSLYITCLKTEKLKISRSIVAAIREQQGRFLERDAKKQTWYDIGDKKAIEKTSQALREGQPKLRQKMIDTGQIAPSHSMEQQFGNGIYNPGSRQASLASNGSGVYSSDGSHFSLNSLGPSSMQMPTSFTGSNMDMPPPPSRTLSNDPMSADTLMQRLSLSSIAPQSIPSWTPSIASSMDGDARSIRSRLRPSLNPSGSLVAGDLGFGPEATMSVMSEFSAYGMNDNFSGIGRMDMERSQQGSMVSAASMMSNNNNNNNYGGGSNQGNNFGGQGMNQMMMDNNSMRSGNDRRRLFAKMKLARQPPSGRSSGRSSDMDGMPDIHMVDSQFSLLSNLSGHGSSRHDRNISMNISGHGLSNLSGHGLSNLSGHGLSNLSGHGGDSMMMDGLGVGSRRSLMSGLSRISDHSGHSVFSDLSKKIGSASMSNRSVAMSEVSGIGEGDGEDDSEQDEFHFDIVPPAKSG